MGYVTGCWMEQRRLYIWLTCVAEDRVVRVSILLISFLGRDDTKFILTHKFNENIFYERETLRNLEKISTQYTLFNFKYTLDFRL